MPKNRPSVLVFDVNETLSDLSPLGDRFAEAGLPADRMPLWFAGILRDGIALAAAGGYADFADLARDGLRALLPAEWAEAEGEAAVEHVVSGFAELNVHPDVPDGVRALRAAGFRLVTMTNGSPDLSEGLLRRAGVRDCFEALHGVRGPGRWKPHPAAYHYPVERAGVRPDQAMLVAVHPWDVDGAQRAGLLGAWIRRGAGPRAYPSSLTPPGVTARDLVELAAVLG
ncbi:haloacid dehalogenase type II [Phaeacidiphilus oryzae]|uniref:haloacid dehalogenase type II n=1 Tax=Phaeacidiphilus oryzae TaxID=348818 RepID=UPI0005621291|nr:haloacid dehalogenase type II [Phaeacidiphilus oryzae]